jgi:L-2-hydroxyglutarate oxidase
MDYLVIGGGIIGINIARELKSRDRDAEVVVIEKESEPGEHASGRNSGVLHAGFYYTADSLKAQFTRDGNRELTAYCESRGVTLNKCGKLVVAKNEQEEIMLDELLRRGEANEVILEELSEIEASKIEPRVKTYKRAIFSPTTSTANPKEVLSAMIQDAKDEGVDVRYGVAYIRRTDNGVETSEGEICADYIVNAAGLYADKVAKDYGFSQNYTILPFKGLYLKSNEPAGAYQTNIYPVPDLNDPFLGVHFTLQVDGQAKIGPTAIPALWREQYSGWSNFRLREFLDIAVRTSGLMLSSDFNFKKLALTEVKKYSRKQMVKLATSLAHGVEISNFTTWAKPGIRAQLYDTNTHKLEMDFVLEGDEHSMHVLNAVSPGWTCSLPFSRHVVDKIQQKLQTHSITGKQ